MPEVSYLFRYRDLIAQTLAEHQKILAKEGACWWGWWKRPLEHARMDVWNALAEQIDKDGHVWVGLFDSGSNKAYPARLTKVILPKLTSGSVEECEQLEPPKGEELLVPVYYRTSPFSRAWMKLDKIVHTELHLYGPNGYAYRKAPPLDNFDPAALTNHLVGKTIHDGAELRAMDTTIWEVEPAKAGAREGVVFTFGSHLYPPVGGAPIQLKHNSILHITDLHYAVDSHRGQHAWKLDAETLRNAPTLADAISTALSVDNVKIGAIAVTGDLTFLGSTAEFDAASSGLNSLLGKLDLGHEHLVVVPGNHDIQWTKKTTYKKDDKVSEAPEEATKNYKDFFASTNPILRFAWLGGMSCPTVR